MGPLLAVLLIVSIARTGHGEEACAPALARIVSLQGTVERRASESEPWSPAALDDRLCADSWLRVGPFSRAALALPNDSVLRLDQQTTVRLRAHAEQVRSLLELFLGTLHLFSHRPRALEVDTPFVNAATEGTEFLVTVGADRTRIMVFEGRVLAQNPDGELLLASGEAAVAVAGTAPRTEIVARPRDAVAWTLYYPPVLAALAGRERAARGLAPGLQAAVDRVAANDYPGALRALDAVPERARDARYYTYRAGVLLNVGRVDDARAAIDRALALDPQAGDALAERAVIAIVQDRRDQALADAQRAVELRPESAAARIALSYAQQGNFQLEAARATLQDTVEIAPEDALAWARLSEIELSFGALNAALDAANRAVALGPELSRTQMVLGFADLARFDVGEARTAFERAIALDSAAPLPRLGLGLALIRQSDLEQGRNEIEIAVALDPDDSLLRSYLGKAFFEEKRDGQAGEQYAIAKRLDPLDPTPWLYDAIRLQTQNRPVEALRELNRSIALNDNRAVYRSSLLLDEDLATRQVSLARIYDDLGFEQVGLLQATRSLSLSPANSSAHRFLSDVYAGLPRHEIARASELLQAQLLQPININPIQPSLPITDLNIVAGAGLDEPSFNELTPLFERNQAQLTATGLIGNNDTIGDEIIVSGLYDRYSVSAGQLHSGTDGFRENNDVDNDLYNLFAQAAATPELNFQTEYRRRETRQGDLPLRFDPDFFFDDERRRLNQDTVRAGARWSPQPELDGLASFFYTDDKESFPAFGDKIKDDGYQAEGRLLYDDDLYNITLGGGFYDISVDSLVFGDREKFTREQDNLYVYTNLTTPRNLTWTIGLSYDRFDEGILKVDRVNPKFGLEWQPNEYLTVRGAWFQYVKRALVAQQTIEPTQVAGFNQFLDDFDGTKATAYNAAIDGRLGQNLYVGAEAGKRELAVPVFIGPDVVTENQDEETITTYLYWTPHERWAAGVEYVFDRFRSDDSSDPDLPSKITTMSVPVTVRYFDPLGFFAEMTGTFVDQHLRRGADASFPQGKESFFLFDAAIGYRLPRRLGILSLEGINLLDQGFDYQDDNFRTSEDRSPALVPERTVLARLTLNF